MNESVWRFALGADADEVRVGYFRRAMQLLDTRKQPAVVVRLARLALREDLPPPDAARMWAALFQHEMRLSRYDEAWLAASKQPGQRSVRLCCIVSALRADLIIRGAGG